MTFKIEKSQDKIQVLMQVDWVGSCEALRGISLSYEVLQHVGGIIVADIKT